jgi:uncharacterized repeat protein (TIGR01451 family)
MALNNPTSKHLARRIVLRLHAALLLLLAATGANAQDCSDYPDGTLDGFAGTVAPSQLQIDRNCTIRNYPESNPLRTNFSFFTQPGQTNERWLIIFDNVIHIGNMSCNDVLEHKIWFTNGSSSKIRQNCQNLLIPVEKIDKANPPGPPTAAIGVPFTYTLTLPVLFDPGTSTVINTDGSVNDLHGVTLWDDLNATGVDLSYVSHSAYWKDSGAPITPTFSNAGGFLTFDNFPIIPAGEQIILEITVVLEDTPANAPGTQFVNTAKWEFGRLVEGVFYEPLPGEWGISDPLTIAAPELVVTKTGPATLGRTLNLGEWGEFGIDVHNAGLSEAWDVTIVDRLPDGASGGMCNATPEILDAQVFAADGVTPVPGKGALTEGTDYSISYSGGPDCELTLTMLTPAAVIGADERLVINYRTQLDSDSQNGATLTNVVGATRWFNGDNGIADRVEFNRTLTDGTPGVDDHQDEHTVTVALFGYFFEKTVENRASGEYPATTAAPGDMLRYTLRLQTTDGALNDVRFVDDLGELNSRAVFEPGSLTLVPGTLPPGAVNNSNPTGGTNSAGVIDISGLDVPAAGEVSIQFDITLSTALIDGTVVTNQADLLGITGIQLASSDDPFVNGQADPSVPGDEDPTRVVIEAMPPSPLIKENTQATATIGEEFSYRITIPSTPHAAPLFDIRILDDLNISAADLQFVSVSRVSGSGGWTPTNTGTPINLVIEDPGTGIDIPAGEQVVIDVNVRLSNTANNVAGLTFTNTASFTYNQLDNQPATQLTGLAGATGPMTIVEPKLTLEKTGPFQMRLGVADTFTLNIHNIGASPAYNVTVDDVLPRQADGGMCDMAPTRVVAQLFDADGVTAMGPTLASGTDFDVTFNGDPSCTFTFTTLTPAAAIGPNQRLIINYDAELDADTERDAVLTNVAGATEWFSLDVSNTGNRNYARRYTRLVTDGTVGILDHEDAHTIIEFTPLLVFEKTAVNVTTGEDPAAAATPGDTIRYRLYVENTSDTPVGLFSIVDELDRLNAAPSFAPGTLNILSVPVGADASNTNPNGGGAGTGLLDVRNLSLGGVGDSIAIEFEVTLAPAITNGSYVANQSSLVYFGNTVAISDDPNVNGPADPTVSGDEDPTRILIQSAPEFDIDKISTYLTGDPNVLMAGERLRYTITVQNIGTDHASDVRIIDLIPANTTYVAGSTTLNGVVLADTSVGTSALTDGILINAPQDTTPGVMNAGVANNVATITFDVVVYPDAPDGTVISNQAFLNSAPYGIADQPSDDPRTAVPDDPTRDIVGALPLLFAAKSVVLQVDAGSPGIVDPGDTLRYTIQIYNNGTREATGVRLADVVPANVTYVTNSTSLNGEPVGQPDNGVFPLIDRIDVSSADLTPPLPGSAEGVLSPGESAVVQFDMQVDAGVPAGTLITNQAVVYSSELSNLLTDGDGDPSTGPEPTVVVVGDVQLLTIAKDVAVVDGGPAIAGATLEYTVTVRNAGSVPALYTTITDDLDAVNPGYLSYVDQTARLNGLASGVSFAGTTITADYFNEYGALEPGEAIILRFRAVMNTNLVDGTTVTNEAEVSWNDPLQTAAASVSIDVGGVPGVGILSGAAWHDTNYTNTFEAGESALEGWTVTLLRDGQPVRSVVTDADGSFTMIGVVPNYLSGEQYSLVYSAPGAGPRTAPLGRTDSDFTDGMQRIDDIVVQGGSNLRDLDLPIDPNGVIYDSIARTPVPNATVTMVDARSGSALPTSCFDDPAQQDQVTLARGHYKFDLNFSDPSCPSSSDYAIRVTPPDSGYVSGISEFIPPTSGEATAAFDVPLCPGSANDAIPATSQHCEAQLTEIAPPPSVQARSAGTVYHLHLRLDASQQPGSSQLFNNHIPLDPRLDGAIAITKTTSLVNVSRGQMVPYTITVSNSFGVDLQDIAVVDRFPAGFRYVEGSARFDDVKTEPDIVGRELRWSDLTLATDGRHELKLLMAVGAGVSEGEFTNRAQAVSALTGGVLSEEATATVRIVPDPTFDCTDVTGKVFDDANRNGYQDGGEEGIAGVRVVTARGLAAKTDNYGRYHITCAITPNEARGSNFVLKLDDRTLPSGFRASTRPVQVQRATRGKALKINFGASIHRVVGLDIADAAFEPGTTEMRPQWRPRIPMLLEELKKAPSVLRLSYVADVEEESLVNRRLDTLKRNIMTAWEEIDCCYELVIEPEIFWRLGGPPDQAREASQ